MHSIRWQFPIGQGFFQAGLVHCEGAEHLYVYDCGSSSLKMAARQSVIDDFRRQLGQGKIDSLFVSHFDHDHVNGIRQLLSFDGGPGAGTAYLPYLAPSSRVCIALREIERSGEDLSYEYREFLINPVSWLRSEGVDEVVYIYGDQSEGEGGPPVDPDEGPPPEPTKRIAGFKDQTTEKATLHIARKIEDQPPPWLEYEETKGFRKDAKFMRHTSAIRLDIAINGTGCWLLITFVDPDREGGTSLKSKISNLVSQTAGKSTRGDELVRSILTDRFAIRNLRRAYQDVFGKKHLNGTSLSLYSGPDLLWRHKESVTHSDTWRSIARFGYASDESTKSAWLNTGDSEFGRGRRVVSRFQDFFSRFTRRAKSEDLLKRVHYFSVPHHGSMHNTSAEFLSPLRGKNCIIPAGRKSKYGHPHLQTLNLLLEHECDFSVVDEAESNQVVLADYFSL